LPGAGDPKTPGHRRGLHHSANRDGTTIIDILSRETTRARTKTSPKKGQGNGWVKPDIGRGRIGGKRNRELGESS